VGDFGAVTQDTKAIDEETVKEFSLKAVLITTVMTLFNIVKTLLKSYFQKKSLKISMNEYFLHTLTGKSNFLPYIDALSRGEMKDFNGAINFEKIKYFFTDRLIDTFTYEIKQIDRDIDMKNWDAKKTAQWIKDE